MLSVVSLEKAKEIIKENFSYKTAEEKVNTQDALFRVLSQDIISTENIPPFSRSTVDGYALIAKDTFGATESMPSLLTLKGEILMGQKPETGITFGECMKIPTGAMLPEKADSAIMIEHTSSEFSDTVLCLKSVAPFENVTKTGDDVKIGDLILKQGTEISSKHIGVLCSLGVSEVLCRKKPKVAIISTGDEIVDFKTAPKFGQIRDINSVMLEALFNENGCETKNYGIVPDEKQDLEKVFDKALKECDTVLLSGGSSAGEKDMTARIISEKGTLLFHGLAMKPGKPTILGKVNEKAVFGLPGHPSAAYFVSLVLVMTFINSLTGRTEKTNTKKAKMACNIPSNHGRLEIIPVKLKDGTAFPLFGKSGLVSLLSSCDGYAVIDRNREGLFCGEDTDIFLL